RQISRDPTGEMRYLNPQCRKLVEKAAVDQAHRRHHQGEFPAEHPPEIVRIHGRPRDHSRQRMNEHVEPEVGYCPPEWAQAFRIKCLSLQLGCNHDTGKAKLDGAALEFGTRALWV